MVQEVQTSVNTYAPTTLNTIEWIWTSSVKLVEWRQTIEKIKVLKCQFYASVSWYYSERQWTWRDSWDIRATNTEIISQTWEYEQRIIDSEDMTNWIRIPVAWLYEISFTWYGGSSTMAVTNSVMLNWKTILSGTDSGSIKISLWKYDILSYSWRFYYSWSSSSINWNTNATISITKI